MRTTIVIIKNRTEDPAKKASQSLDKDNSKSHHDSKNNSFSNLRNKLFGNSSLFTQLNTESNVMYHCRMKLTPNEHKSLHQRSRCGSHN